MDDHLHGQRRDPPGGPWHGLEHYKDDDGLRTSLTVLLGMQIYMWMIGWLNDWMIEWLHDWMIEWLNDWMSVIEWLKDLTYMYSF